MAGEITFLQNNFVLVYENGYTGETPLIWRFDIIQDMEAKLDMGLYTEGTGNLAYSKGATNPVSFVFRKTFDISTAEKAPFTGKRRFNVKGDSLADNSGLITTSMNEASIFEWAEKINGGKVDSGIATIYANIKISGTVDSGPVVFLKLKNAFPVSANVKRNPYSGTQKAHLTFVADGMETTNFNMKLNPTSPTTVVVKDTTVTTTTGGVTTSVFTPGTTSTTHTADTTKTTDVKVGSQF